MVTVTTGIATIEQQAQLAVQQQRSAAAACPYPTGSSAAHVFHHAFEQAAKTTEPITMTKKSIFVHGPQGCGKTRFKEKLAKHFDLHNVLDDWAPGDKCPIVNHIILTRHNPPAHIRRQLSFADAIKRLQEPAGYPF